MNWSAGFAGRPILAILLASCGWLSAGAAPAEPTYDALLASCLARQPDIEAQLIASTRCLGERLDGFIEFNGANPACTEAQFRLVEAENADRASLNTLMAPELRITPKSVGEQRAVRYAGRYKPGVLRQVRLGDGDEVTWWDGFAPDPRLLPASRVLTRPRAIVREAPDGAGQVVRDGLQQYEAFGVVDVQQDGSGARWYQVTEDYVPKIKPPDWNPRALGWLHENDAIPWPRAVAMRFTSPQGRPRSLLFGSADALIDAIGLPPTSRQEELDRLGAGLQRGDLGPDPAVVALEPELSVNQPVSLTYPVLDFHDRRREQDLRIDGQSARLLQVAARSRPAGDPGRCPSGPIQLDIVFVMDTTQSMGPYLARVLRATERFVQDGRMTTHHLGFVGFQDVGPGFDYTAKAFTTTPVSPVQFVSTLKGVQALDRPTPGDDYPEAVFEGIVEAVERTAWRENSVKLLFLVGDAPGKARGGLTLEQAKSKLDDRGGGQSIRLMAFHIPDTASKAYDAEAQRQYKALSSQRDTGEVFWRSMADTGSDFEEVVYEILNEAVDSILQVQSGEKASPGSPTLAPKPGSLAKLIFEEAALLLGDTCAPEHETIGWASDKVLTDPGRSALQPLVLFDRAELEELRDRVAELKEVGEAALRGAGGTTLDFFDLVSRNTRITMVNPSAVDFRDAFSAPLGIDQLPYDSDIMTMTRDEFRNPDQVQDFVRAMTNKLAHYEDLLRQRGDQNVWKLLSRGAAEPVVAVELDQLP